MLSAALPCAKRLWNLLTGENEFVFADTLLFNIVVVPDVPLDSHLVCLICGLGNSVATKPRHGHIYFPEDFFFVHLSTYIVSCTVYLKISYQADGFEHVQAQPQSLQAHCCCCSALVQRLHERQNRPPACPWPHGAELHQPIILLCRYNSREQHA
jgi:hypothetical protein